MAGSFLKSSKPLLKRLSRADARIDQLGDMEGRWSGRDAPFFAEWISIAFVGDSHSASDLVRGWGLAVDKGAARSFCQDVLVVAEVVGSAEETGVGGN